MPAKRTFPSLRVRGPAQFDLRPSHKGTPLVIFREYVAILQQAGPDAPLATVMSNTLGGEPVWTRVSAGVYRLTLAGAFPAGNRVLLPNVVTLYDDGILGTITFSLLTPNAVQVQTVNAGTDSTDGLLDYFGVGFHFSVRVYPAE